MLMLVGALVAGVLGSIGPCTPLRLVSVSVFASRKGMAGAFAAYFAGSISAIVAVVVLLGELVTALNVSPLLYAIAAAALFVVGLRLLVLVGHTHSKADEKTGAASFGSAFLLGASQSLLVQPCCAPGLLWLMAEAPSTSLGLLVGASALFAVGQSLLVLAAPLVTRIRVSPAFQSAATWALGTFSLMAGIYYAIQA